ncbi:hypothetical protein Dimus_028296 [Dionaea muscipula]
MRANSFNGREPDQVPMIRRPLSPISRVNSTNQCEDENIPLNDQPDMIVAKNQATQKTTVSTQPTTPLRTVPAADEENMTPMAMQMTMTPAVLLPPHAPLSRDNSSEEDAADGEVEYYSFEERRAGFILSYTDTDVKRAIQV